MSIGSGIAVVGIWLAVAVIGHANPGAGCLVGIFAAMATAAVCAQ